LRRRGRPPYLGALTPRQQDVYELLGMGLTNEEIAERLGITLDGAKYHVSLILQRLGAENRYEAVSLHLRTQGSGRFAAWAPVILLRKLPFASPRRVFDWLPHAAAGAVFTATAAGIALLAWGVISTSSPTVTTTGGSAEQSDAANAAPRAPGVAQSGAGTGAITAISAGLFHSCALKGGGVWCWGAYYITDGITPATAPMAMPGLTSGVSAISADGTDSCALKDGGVWCWGANPAGDGITAPLAVPGLESGVSALDGTCAVKDGGAWCRNYNSATDSAEVVAVPGLASGVSAISTGGGDHTCAVKDGGAWCWGSNFARQLGNNGTDSPVPVAVSELASGVSAISAGGGYSCALKDGGVWCWGDNSKGQLGNDNTTDVCGLDHFPCTHVPVAASGLTSGVSAISTDQNHTCALKDGGVWCWGDNSPVPVVVPGLASGVSAISVGSDHSCALKVDGAWCWGRNDVGQLGINRPTWIDVPVAVSGLTSGVSALISGDGGASATSAGGAHRCALKEGGVWCWGWNDEGQLGNNSTTDSPVPVAVPGLGSGVSVISAGPCALKDDVLWCWGRNYFGGESHVPVAVPGLVSGVVINETCALKDGGVWCNPEAPVAVPGFESGVSAMSAGPPCALKDGGVWCARLDNGLPLVLVPGLERGVSAISGSCALQDGGVSCWGWGEDNGLPGLANRPVPVPGLESGVSAISVDRSDDFHICALKDGGVWCSRGGTAGTNAGIGSTAGAVAMPGLGSGVSAISGTCALKEGGVWCWGSNSNGQLGNGSPADSYSLVPVAVQLPPASAAGSR
jgi:DNA-binding CsgD family transcriptional regulator